VNQREHSGDPEEDGGFHGCVLSDLKAR